MTVQAILQVKDGDTLGTVRGFLKTLLDQGVVGSMLVPLEVPSADQVAPVVVKEAKQLDTANPLAPVMRINAASVIARLQKDGGASPASLVLRPCELRAVIELAKVGRIDLTGMMLIGIDCMGTYEPEAYAQIARAWERSPTDEMMRWTRQGPIAPYRLRNACQICEHFIAENADIAIGMIGLNVRERLLIQITEDIAGKLHPAQGRGVLLGIAPRGPAGSCSGSRSAGVPRGLSQTPRHLAVREDWRSAGGSAICVLTPSESNGRDKAITRMSAVRRHRREQALANAAQLLHDLPSLVALLAPCTACGECLDACPFCDTAAFVPSPVKEPRSPSAHAWASGRIWDVEEGAAEPFASLVALGRRAAACVGCGMCESACARHVPLTAIQAYLGSKVQEEFGYVPGRSVNEKLPWATA